jgi:coenzyme F420-reducing hydrogenase delta subunit
MCERDECRHLEGNMRAEKRAEAVESLLQEIGLGAGRVAVIHRNSEGMAGIIKKIEAFRTQVSALPPSIDNPSGTIQNLINSEP